ncbi:hypothetical protein NPIL_389671 [Nephila pilipes]|uniref:RRM domain-containing protein n=1 Tax=Nephila pilipes TaxID=299642 RepID=A0A8X6UL57_NEPPI|nr:hypothetical protein NPIL_389671 [Nephila pilipes]
MTNAKLYIGNLPPNVDEDSLKELLKDKSGTLPISVLVKRGGYAFVECKDPATAERAIASLNEDNERKKLAAFLIFLI